MKAFFSRVRALLVLGRISNLPTVWSNLIAGCFLAGGHVYISAIIPLLTAVSFLYIGGMYLNDLCDAKFDARYRPERPIPAKKISRLTVTLMTLLWFTLGLAGLSRFSGTTFAIGIALTVVIVIYDLWHKNNPIAPLLMGFCRFLLYPLAGSVAQEEMSWRIFLWAAAIGLYVSGISYMARGESRPGKPARWALVLLVLPLLFATGIALAYSIYVILPFCLIFAVWTAWALRSLWRKSIPRAVSALLAGIILADVMVLAPVLIAAPAWAIVYGVLFIAALLLQLIIPAT